MEANFGFGRLWRRFQQGAELLEDFPQRYIVNRQRFVYLGKASENGSMEETLKPEMLKLNWLGIDAQKGVNDNVMSGSGSERGIFSTPRLVVVPLHPGSAFCVAMLALG